MILRAHLKIKILWTINRITLRKKGESHSSYCQILPSNRMCDSFHLVICLDSDLIVRENPPKFSYLPFSCKKNKCADETWPYDRKKSGSCLKTTRHANTYLAPSLKTKYIFPNLVFGALFLQVMQLFVRLQGFYRPRAELNLTHRLFYLLNSCC